ncbi:hypothetical protein NUU61_009881 [Penicillium alfredii]|uniref:Uncharacterized protein n=1 Tax=Penicillium alfredii TaxID=1506179 RepID=A0A9W9JUG0_9EURO|nr:uncharacterized protein NUU61_009881 [Penicillium alfredii]KAJ5081617.1 hypothetical protein NUU61_009881 [Penicillium alfredii]
MSFGRHAYRHALKPPAAPILDHLWISDDLLAATFRRFANGQRRHGSCVPGPLEARRRLAKRRNAVLASIGGGPAEDIACLFGRNGREHMKWTDHPWQRAQLEPQDLGDYTASFPEVPLPFSDQNPGPSELHIPDVRPPDLLDTEKLTRGQLLDEFLRKDHWGIEDARDFARRLRIDLQREPAYSRQIFDRLLVRSTSGLTEAIAFLEDPFLNTRGSGNYLAAVELFVRRKAKRSQRTGVLNAINRALELGLVSTDELCMILKAMPGILVERSKTLGTWDQIALVKHYRAMWRAIGRCNILGYRDLDQGIVYTWLEELLHARSFHFAREIVVATHGAGSDGHWPSILIKTWLEAGGKLSTETSLPFPVQVLDQIDTDCAADCIIRVTEFLTLSSRDKARRDQLLELWRKCLLRMPNVSALAESPVWIDLSLAYPQGLNEQPDPLQKRSTRHQIILRLWGLRTLCRSLGPMYNQSCKATDRPIYELLSLYETAIQHTDGPILSDLMRGIHDLNIPYNSLLILAVDLKLKKLTTKTTRKTLEQLETSQTSLAEVWANPSTYKGIRALFYGTFEEMFRRLDLTSTASVEECLRLARVGDSQSIWSLLRLLRNHTPIKLCLHKAWLPLPHPDEKVVVRYHPGPRNSECPDPHVAVDLIHQLAVAFSCCRQLTPSRSFHLIHWLYDYLRRHGGPVYPELVRAMYHAGVVRYRREGRRVSPTQYEYIMWIIRKFEGHDVVEELSLPPEIGGSMSDCRHDGS